MKVILFTRELYCAHQTADNLINLSAPERAVLKAFFSLYYWGLESRSQLIPPAYFRIFVITPLQDQIANFLGVSKPNAWSILKSVPDNSKVIHVMGGNRLIFREDRFFECVQSAYGKDAQILGLIQNGIRLREYEEKPVIPVRTGELTEQETLFFALLHGINNINFNCNAERDILKWVARIWLEDSFGDVAIGNVNKVTVEASTKKLGLIGTSSIETVRKRIRDLKKQSRLHFFDITSEKSGHHKFKLNLDLLRKELTCHLPENLNDSIKLAPGWMSRRNSNINQEENSNFFMTERMNDSIGGFATWS
ncbi:hypothetical protein [Rubinisphaera italica]|uniref:Uncharacterized protein n=1 Tax=Rubinisphaera italica TaxID=2527969 RepID=A0A5C5XN25_9PLAN|nr:hypothetical protein [Rubinisphaera italica]TWT63152.1 hypothetical protein Pan54_39050 [Rubinisphaera italica]